MATTYDEHIQGLLDLTNRRQERLRAAATAQNPFVLLLPTDPLPEGLPEGTIVIRAAATAPPPQVLGLTGTIDNTLDANPASVDISTVPNGSWMLAVTSSLDVPLVPIMTPAGWTELFPLTVAGTLRITGYAKIKTPADSVLLIDQGQTILHATSVLYGPGDTSIGDWVVSSVANRSTSTATTTVAPGIPNAPEGSLVFAFAAERTTAAELTEPTATAPKVTYLAGSTADGIESLYVAQPTNPETPTTFTYPNAQASNGLAVTVAVTP